METCRKCSPGGNAPMYYAHTLIKFVSKDKYKEETDGFDGFLVRAELLKCRTNNAGKTCDMVYNQRSGFDPVLTLFKFIDDGGLVDVLDGGFQLIVGSCLRLRLEIQEHECTCKQQ